MKCWMFLVLAQYATPKFYFQHNRLILLPFFAVLSLYASFSENRRDSKLFYFCFFFLSRQNGKNFTKCSQWTDFVRHIPVYEPSLRRSCPHRFVNFLHQPFLHSRTVWNLVSHWLNANLLSYKVHSIQVQKNSIWKKVWNTTSSVFNCLLSSNCQLL